MRGAGFVVERRRHNGRQRHREHLMPDELLDPAA
jgi:hypothetical protein